jgi:hypothetical protein
MAEQESKPLEAEDEGNAAANSSVGVDWAASGEAAGRNTCPRTEDTQDDADDLSPLDFGPETALCW